MEGRPTFKIINTMKRVTLKALAKELKVSVSTVSKALSGSKEISDETSRRIVKLAKKYNYSPNQIARSLKIQKTKTIGVIIPNILSHYFAEVLLGIEEEAIKQGYNIITLISNESYEKEVKSIKMFLNGTVDGFLVSLAKETQVKQKFDHFELAINQGYPIVMFDRVTDFVHCDKVIIDDYDITYETTNNLINSGFKNIIFISTISEVSVGKIRAIGYENAINENKNYYSKPVTIAILSFEKYYSVLSQYLKNNVVDAIIASDELSAIYALNISKAEGYHIPDDISVIGFTDGILSKNSVPQLTTVDQKPIQVGKQSLKVLIKRLNNKSKESFTTKVIKTNIIQRDSLKKIIN